MPSRELQRVLRQNDQLQMLRAEDQQRIRELEAENSSAHEEYHKILEVYGYSDGAEWMRKVDAKACIDGGFTHAICDGSFVDIFISGDQVGFGELLGEVFVSRPDESGSPVCEPTHPQLLATIIEQRLATINGQQIVIDDLTKQLENATKTCDHQQGSILNLLRQVENLKYNIGNIGANTPPQEGDKDDL